MNIYEGQSEEPKDREATQNCKTEIPKKNFKVVLTAESLSWKCAVILQKGLNVPFFTLNV